MTVCTRSMYHVYHVSYTSTDTPVLLPSGSLEPRYRLCIASTVLTNFIPPHILIINFIIQSFVDTRINFFELFGLFGNYG